MVRDRFVTDLMKNKPFVAEQHKKISTYIYLAQPHQKTLEILTRNNNVQNFNIGPKHYFQLR